MWKRWLLLLPLLGSLASAPAAPIAPGEEAPAFELQDLDGKLFRLSDYEGKVVVLDFWATWCGYCRRAMPHVQELADRPEVADGKLVILALSSDDDQDKLREYIAKNKLTVPIPLDPKRKIGVQYGAKAIPTMVVLKPDLTVAWSDTIGNEEKVKRLDEAIDQTLAEAFPPAE